MRIFFNLNLNPEVYHRARLSIENGQRSYCCSAIDHALYRLREDPGSGKRHKAALAFFFKPVGVKTVEVWWKPKEEKSRVMVLEAMERLAAIHNERSKLNRFIAILMYKFLS